MARSVYHAHQFLLACQHTLFFIAQCDSAEPDIIAHGLAVHPRAVVTLAALSDTAWAMARSASSSVAQRKLAR